jgi:hypothetical protein
MNSFTDLNYMTAGKLRQLDEIASKYTCFKTFLTLIDKSNNFRPVWYNDPSLANFARRDLDTLAKAYDDHMIRNYDDRRVYKMFDHPLL